MNRRRFLGTALAAGQSLFPTKNGAAWAMNQSRPALKFKPNVIILLSDDTGLGDLSGEGNPVLKTPNLDRLRRVSTRLTDFHVSPMCTPTRGQLLTGRDALANRAMNVSSGRALLRPDIPTLGDIFSASGYATGIFGKWHVGDTYPYRPQDRGFQETLWFPSSHIGSAPDYWDNDYDNDTYRHNGHPQKYQGYCTDVFFREAMSWMRKMSAAGRPFFTYLPLNAAHAPLFVPDQFRKPYSSQPQDVASFFGMIANIDENTGRLEKMLEETGLRENTILIYLSDNGGTYGVKVYNAGMRGHKVTLWEGGHRVPCYISWPAGKIPQNRSIDELTEVQDFAPTLVELCGLTVPSGTRFDGTSLARLLRGKEQHLPDRQLVVQFSRMNAARPQKGDAAVLWKKWRLLPDNRLYNVETDLGQNHDVAQEHPDIVAKMRAHYDRWWKGVEGQLDTFLPVHIGSDKENPVLVSPTEWADVFLDQSIQIRAGLRRNGIWHIQIEQPGEYQFVLRRWPENVEVSMQSGLPAHDGELGSYKAGVALPIARADLLIAGQKFTSSVQPGARQAVFHAKLVPMQTTMQTWFRDKSGNEICGAYYVYVKRLN